MRRITECDIAFAILLPLTIWAFYITASPDHAWLEAGRVAIIAIFAYGLGTSGRLSNAHGAT